MNMNGNGNANVWVWVPYWLDKRTQAIERPLCFCTLLSMPQTVFQLLSRTARKFLAHEAIFFKGTLHKPPIRGRSYLVHDCIVVELVLRLFLQDLLFRREWHHFHYHIRGIAILYIYTIYRMVIYFLSEVATLSTLDLDLFLSNICLGLIKRGMSNLMPYTTDI